MKSAVAIVRCTDYDEANVLEAVGRAVDLIGGMGAFATPGETILVKPNLLAGDPPERAVTTHPAVFGAVVKLLVAAGARAEYGDSPGFGTPAAAARKAGITHAGARAGGYPGNFTEQVNLPLPGGNALGLPALPVARAVRDADGIVSVSKLKTHGLMRITGALKNQLGCVMGFHKARMHLIGGDSDRFARILVDIDAAVAPRLYVMDAVVAMEGNGPRSGTPREMGVILASTDPVALDATACRLMALDPTHVPTTLAGEEGGRGTWRAGEIDVTGDPLEEFITRDFEVIRSPAHHHILSHNPFLRNLLDDRPVIETARCRKCGVCVEACPVPSKAVRFPGHEEGAPDTSLPPEFHYRECIRCFCCQEMCPHEAIRVHTPLLGRLPVVRRRVSRRA